MGAIYADLIRLVRIGKSASGDRISAGRHAFRNTTNRWPKPSWSSGTVTTTISKDLRELLFFDVTRYFKTQPRAAVRSSIHVGFVGNMYYHLIDSAPCAATRRAMVPLPRLFLSLLASGFRSSSETNTTKRPTSQPAGRAGDFRCRTFLPSSTFGRSGNRRLIERLVFLALGLR
jgi:hypothetical protein